MFLNFPLGRKLHRLLGRVHSFKRCRLLFFILN